MAKLLIIEDDPYVARFYERLFRYRNYDLIVASNGEEGLEKAVAANPDLVLLDILMPKMNGLEVLKKLKENPQTKNITVVMLTNIGDEKTAKEAAALGASGFIVKSQAPPEKLHEIVNSFINK